jgi:hypothetical protein
VESFDYDIKHSLGVLFAVRGIFDRRKCLADCYAALFSTGGASFPQQRLYFAPDLQGQGAFRGKFLGKPGVVAGAVEAALQFEAISAGAGGGVGTPVNPASPCSR